MKKIENKKALYGILSGCAVFIIMLGIFINKNDIEIENESMITKQSETIESKKDSLLDFFTIKVYVASLENKNNIEEKNLNANVEIPLAKYNQAMSSVPGLPFKIEIDSQNVSQISIKTDNGEILTLDEKTGKVSNEGKKLLYNINDKTKDDKLSYQEDIWKNNVINPVMQKKTNIFYWSPQNTADDKALNYEESIWNNKDIETIAQIKIEITSKEDEIEKVIYIGEDNYNYYAIENKDSKLKYISTTNEIKE